MADQSEGKKKKGFWRHAFAVETPEEFKPDEQELAVMDKVAQRICRHGLAIPAILFLESSRPMNFIGASAMAYFEPIVRGIFTEWEGYSTFYKMMERRGSVECLIDRVEHFENERQEQIKQAKLERKRRKLDKKKGRIKSDRGKT